LDDAREAYHVLTGTSTFEIEPPTVGDMLERRTGIVAARLPYLVAEVEGEIAGYAYAGPDRPRPAYRYTVEDSVYIASPWQGRRFGRQLLAGVITACERQGFRQMIAAIGDSQNVASVRLHSALGFRMVGVLNGVGLKFDRWIDTVLMQRELGAGTG
jgi:L-amino acid N-acyltransferase YncA